MKIINYSELRNNLAEIIDEVLDHVPVIIAGSAKKQPVIMLSLEDFNSYETTSYLTKSPANRKRLLSSVRNVKNGKYKKHSLATNEAD